MAQLVYSIGDRVLVDDTLFEVAELAANRFGGPNYKLVTVDPNVGVRPRWLTPRRDGSRASVIDRRALSDLVYSFYDSVRADPELSPIFAKRLDGRWPDHLERMVRFWSSALLEERSFIGNPMIKHRAIDDAVPKNFERWLALFDAALEKHFEPKAGRYVRERAYGMARGLSTGMFGQPFDAGA